MLVKEVRICPVGCVMDVAAAANVNNSAIGPHDLIQICQFCDRTLMVEANDKAKIPLIKTDMRLQNPAA